MPLVYLHLAFKVTSVSLAGLTSIFEFPAKVTGVMAGLFVVAIQPMNSYSVRVGVKSARLTFVP